MFSCSSALTAPISRRVVRNALRACDENHNVATSMIGVTAILSSAKTRFSVSML